MYVMPKEYSSYPKSVNSTKHTTHLPRPPCSISIRVASLPSADFEDSRTAEFVAQAIGAPDNGEEEQSSNSSSSNSSLSRLLQTRELVVKMEVVYYHCRPGNFWNYTTSDSEFLTCLICTDIQGDPEVIDDMHVFCPCFSSMRSMRLRVCPCRMVIYTVFIRYNITTQSGPDIQIDQCYTLWFSFVLCCLANE